MSFLGIGPGRCGTMTVSKYLNGCGMTWALHEEYRVAVDVMDCVSWMEAAGLWPIWNIGFIGIGWTMHVDAVRKALPKVPVICLHRPKDEVIESFSKVAITHADNLGWAMPTVMTRDETANHWETAERMMAKVEAPVLHVQTKQLSDDDTIKMLFEFVKVPESQRRMPTKRIWNKRSEQIKSNEIREKLQCLRAMESRKPGPPLQFKEMARQLPQSR